MVKNKGFRAVNKIIIINGPSCAGKTTIAKEICKQSDKQFVHLQLDEAKKYLIYHFGF